ncbi:3-oxoacyl-ACP synthase III family protein [Micromonospora sp. NPDC049102]|uniref:3-oxoacyl-ACP synthase III family protein n=1 Tax=Micromonospora sp. NPDC049102 TaxID=3364265 RepID=UPI0037162807
MDNLRRVGIVSTGSYLPARVVGNTEVGDAAAVSAEWIERKTAIRERRYAAPHEATSDLAAAAAVQALRAANLSAGDIRYVVVATSTPDHTQPATATATIVQHLLGARNAAAFDVNAVCSGFVVALTVAERLLRAEPDPSAYALVIGADIYSRIINPADRRTAVLFGDGAGAVVVGPVAPGHGTVSTNLVSHGDRHSLINVPAGGSRYPASAATVADGSHYFQMDGRAVREFVNDHLPQAVDVLLDNAGVHPSQVRHFIPHQANGVMLAEVWPRLGLAAACCHLEVEHHGNTGAASVPLTLDVAHRRGAFAPGELVVLAAFGGGMSVGATVLRWADTSHSRNRPVPARQHAGSRRAPTG